MVNYTITDTRDDTGTTVESVSDSVAEGETDVYEITIEDPSLVVSSQQTPGN